MEIVENLQVVCYRATWLTFNPKPKNKNPPPKKWNFLAEIFKKKPYILLKESCCYISRNETF